MRKSVRVIQFKSYQAHSEPLFKKLGVLNFDNLFKLEAAKFMFDIHHENKNSFFNNEFIETNKLQKYNTMQSSQKIFLFLQYQQIIRKIFLHSMVL